MVKDFGARRMKMKRYLIPIVIVLVLTLGLLVACGQQASSTEIYHNYQYGYMIEYPSSWTLDDSGETVHISRPLREYITVGALEGKQITPEDLEWLFDDMVKEMTISTEDFQLISKARLYDIGHPAWQIVWTGKTNEGLAIKAKTRCIAYKDKLYVITAGAPGIDLPSELETALRSFCFLEEYIYDTKLNEKQVIEITHDYLISKANQLQGFESWWRKIRIDTAFKEALFKAEKEMLSEVEPGKWGDLVVPPKETSPEKSEPFKIPFHTSALEKIAKYDGNRWWAVSIGNYEWYVDERTRKVVAQNEEAASLLKELTLKAYYNGSYGYYIDYPPSWTINAEDENNVLISDNPKDVRAFVFIVAVDGETLASFGGLRGYIDVRLTSFKNEYYAFEKTNVSYLTIDYKYQKKENSPTNEGRLHTFLNGDMLFEIICSGRIIEVPGKSYSNIYDPFDSFRFQP